MSHFKFRQLERKNKNLMLLISFSSACKRVFPNENTSYALKQLI